MSSQRYYRFGMRLKAPDKLKEWWSVLGNAGRNEAKSYLGQLPSLLKVVAKRELVEAAAPFWDEDRGVFRFGRCELTLTLEEIAAYSVLSCKPSDAVILVEDICGRRFASILGLSENKAFEAKARRSGVTLDYLYERFTSEQYFWDNSKQYSATFSQWRKNRVLAFVIAFLGIMVFPMEENRIHIRIGFVVNALDQRIEGRKATLVPLIVAEMYRALHKVKNGARFFEGCNLLLQLWLIEHLQVLENAPQGFFTSPMNRIERPVPEERTDMPREKPFQCPPDVETWTQLLGSLTEDKIQWMYTWLPKSQPLTHTKNHMFFVLGGLRGTYLYVPLRVMRQFGRLQVIPAVVEGKMFIQEFDGEQMPHRSLILSMWKGKIVTNLDTIAPDRYHAGYVSTYLSWLEKDVLGQLEQSDDAPGEAIDRGFDYRTRYLELQSNTLALEREHQAQQEGLAKRIMDMETRCEAQKVEIEGLRAHVVTLTNVSESRKRKFEQREAHQAAFVASMRLEIYDQGYVFFRGKLDAQKAEIQDLKTRLQAQKDLVSRLYHYIERLKDGIFNFVGRLTQATIGVQRNGNTVIAEFDTYHTQNAIQNLRQDVAAPEPV